MASNKKSKKGAKKNMLKNGAIENSELCLIDLAQVEEDGTFKCPKCGKVISPDDENDDAYDILDAKMADDEIAELTIACGTCGTVMKVTGFQNSAEQ